MLGTNIGIRELSAGTNLNIRYIQSAEDDGMSALTEDHLRLLYSYSNAQEHRQEYIIDTAMTVDEMQKAIYAFYETQQKPFVVTLDHTLLIKQAAHERTKQESLQNLAIMLTNAKNHLPVIFIILSQLNREIDNPERQIPGKLSNYPGPSDVYGSDFLMQCADVMIAFNRPAKYNLSLYGPLKYIIRPEDKYLLAMHVLKNRFGELSIQWYNAEYSIMRLVERNAPESKVNFLNNN